MRPKLPVFTFRPRSTISKTIFVMNLTCWVPHFIALGIYSIFGTKSSWNEGIDTYFNVEWVLLGHNFDFLGGSFVVTARYLVFTASYCSLPGGYWLLTVHYCLFPLKLLVWMVKQWSFIRLAYIYSSLISLPCALSALK